MENKLEKIKSLAMAFISFGLICMGSTYFKEQNSYHIPRILYPVFELFGNIGLAIGMLIIGSITLYFAFQKFKKYEGKKSVFLITSLLSCITFIVIILFFDKDNSVPTTSEKIAISEKANEDLKNEIQNMQKPDFENAKVNAYFATIEKLIMEMKENQKEKNTTKIDSNQKKMQELNMKFIQFRNLISDKEEQQKFDKYNAKLTIEYSTINQN